MSRPTSKDEAVVEEIGHSPKHDTDANVEARLQQLVREAPPFYRSRNLLNLYLLMIPGCLVPSVTLGFDSAMMNGLQAVATWQESFDHPQGAVLGLLTAILSLGAIMATPFISTVGDRWGRRVGIIVGSSIMATGGILQGASVHIGMFLASRFLLGFGLVFCNTFAPILIGELAHPKDRSVVTSLYQTSWYIGAIIAAWTTFATFSMPNQWAWRIPSLLQAAPALIQIVGVCFVPESPRWLVAKGRGEKAKQILEQYHADGRQGDELVELEFLEIKSVIETELTSEGMTWKSFLSSKGNRRRMMLMIMLGLFSQWSGNGLVSYYLARVLDTVGFKNNRDKNIINGCLMIWNWITAVSSAFLTAKLKRRTQFMISTVGMLAVFASQTLCAGLFNERGDTQAGYGVVAMLFLFYTFFNLAFNALLYSYPMEVLPYHIRAKGYSILMFSGKAANFVNALANPIGLEALGWKFYNVYIGWLCVEVACVYLFLVETKGPSLEAIADVFDRLDVHFMFDQGSFLRQYALGTVPKIILYSVMALGIRYSHAPFQDPHMRTHWGEPLQRKARQLLQEDFDDPTLTTAQAYVLQATYHLTFGGTRRASLYINNARVVLNILNLQNGLQDDEVDPVQAETIRRLLATVALTDNLMLPFAKNERAFVRIDSMPRLFSDDEYDALRTRSRNPPEVPSAPNLMQEILKLSDLYYKVCEQRRDNPGKSTTSLASAVSTWHSSLPASLSYSESNLQAHHSRFSSRQFAFVHLHYHHIWQIILMDTMSWTTPVLTGNASQRVLPEQIYDHASRIADIVSKVWELGQFDLHNGCFGLLLITTQVVLVHRLLSSTEVDQKLTTQSKMKGLRDCMTRVKGHCRLFNWVFHQSEWLLRVCGQDEFWLHEQWQTVLNDQLMSLGTRFERLDLQTAGRRAELENLANAASHIDHQRGEIPRILREEFVNSRREQSNRALEDR
ncbi:hypothetical protein CkaCkLH20_08608 [Colletotrichum karsti]|uniref:Major facilitator superfamily (MFS) profile domain-containing protein n=1 Tax=Colletotrichum karsti TaxID=1095194 RepID=A0A9P6I067_9PEZI|nr:uncharacterized protein CkaCkLH20_08608 [Colletotrichum karsti]KAF9873874.1 hypothetical protein CkaCkLH20_08608 [Colletotrichum karsti]